MHTATKNNIKNLACCFAAAGMLSACSAASYSEEPIFTAKCVVNAGTAPNGQRFTQTIYATGATIQQTRNHLQFQQADTSSHPCESLEINPINLPEQPVPAPYKISAPTITHTTQYIIHNTGRTTYPKKTLHEVSNAYKNDPSITIEIYTNPMTESELTENQANIKNQHLYNNLRDLGIPYEQIHILPTNDNQTPPGTTTINIAHHAK
mgnify:CR=1 FL=1